MIGDRIRNLREQRSWTQQHLAQAAGVSLRTIQRLESAQSCSRETLLALSAALRVEIASLTDEEVGKGRNGRFPIDGRFAAIAGAIAALPAVLFVLLNVLNSTFGVRAPYHVFAAVGSSLLTSKSFNWLSAILFIGGLSAAIVLNFLALVRTVGRFEDGELHIEQVAVRLSWPNAVTFLVATAALLCLIGYVALENIALLSHH